MSIDLAYQRLRDANPHPSVSESEPSGRARAAVATAKDRSVSPGSMRPDDPSPSRGPVIALVAAIAVLIVAALSWAIIASLDTSGDVVDEQESQLAPDEAAALAVAMEAVEAFNRGDLDAWMATWFEDRFQRVGFRSIFEAKMAAGAHLTVDSCTTLDRTEFLEAEAVTIRVSCEAVETDAFYSPGGITQVGSFVWVVEDGTIVATDRDLKDSGGNQEDYGLAFRNWLVINTEEGSEYETFPWYFPQAGSVPIALERIDEFLADSPEWPSRPDSG